MAIDSQTPVYEKTRNDAAAGLSSIKQLISIDSFNDEFVLLAHNLSHLIDDACTKGEALRISPVAKYETIRRIGIEKMEYMDDLKMIANVPENLRKAVYSECSLEFQKAFPDAKAVKAKLIKRKTAKGDFGSAILVTRPARQTPGKKIFDRPMHNC